MAMVVVVVVVLLLMVVKVVMVIDGYQDADTRAGEQDHIINQMVRVGVEARARVREGERDRSEGRGVIGRGGCCPWTALVSSEVPRIFVGWMGWRSMPGCPSSWRT